MPEDAEKYADDADIAAKVNKWYKEADEDSSDWREEAVEDYNFVAGYQWNDDDITKLSNEGRPVITFNRTNVMISAVMGIEANQRSEAEFLPRDRTDTALADATKAFVKWEREYAEMDIDEAAAFEDMITCGMGWTEDAMDYEVDLDGKHCRHRINPLEMRWDMRSSKRNLSDARYIIHAKRMPKDEILEQWPDANTSLSVSNYDNEESKVSYVNPAERYSRGEDKPPMPKDPVVLRCQWYELERVFRAADPQTGKVIEVPQEQADILRQAGINVIPQKKRVYHQAFVCGTTVLEHGLAPSQSGFTFKCMTGKRDHIYRSWYGLVRLMKDPQRWGNKFFSEILDILASNSKGGIMAEVGAFVDQRKAEEEWAKADSIIYLNAGAISGGKIQTKPVAQYPSGLDRMLQFAITSIREVVGINLEVLGLADREQAGVLEETRKRSAYTILATMFDALRAYRREVGILHLDFIKQYAPIDRIQNVLEPELQPMAETIKQIDLHQFNVIATESPQSENNKQMTWAFVTQIAPFLQKAGIPVPPEILEYSPLPAPLVEKWMALIEQSMQGPSPKEDKDAADVDKKRSSAMLDRARAQKETVQAMTMMVTPPQPRGVE